MSEINDYVRYETRRQFFGRGMNALGWAALASLTKSGMTDAVGAEAAANTLTHFAPKAKRVIYLHMVGGPSQMDLFDYKPKMNDWYDKDLPDSVRNGQRLTGMTSGQARFPIAPSKFAWKRWPNGGDGAWVSELMPHLGSVAHELCFVHSMHTEAINHEPAITFVQTGTQQPGRP